MTAVSTSMVHLQASVTASPLNLLVPDAAKAVATRLAALDHQAPQAIPAAAVAAAVAAVKAAGPMTTPSPAAAAAAAATVKSLAPVTPAPTAATTTAPTVSPAAKTSTSMPATTKKSETPDVHVRPASPSPSPSATCATPAAQVVSAFKFPQPTIQPPAASVSMPPHAVVVSASVSATAPTTTVTKRSSKTNASKQLKGNTGRWTEAEHKLFLKGLEQFPYRAWKKIATLIKTRTVVQIRTHAQKYYQKLEKEEQRVREREAQLVAQQGLAAMAGEAAAVAAAAASRAERSIQVPTPVTASTTVATSAALAALAATNALAEDALRKKPVLRKRKFGDDAVVTAGAVSAAASAAAATVATLVPVPVVPAKRLLREKKILRDKTMSPKQKVVLASKATSTTGLFDLLAPRPVTTTLASPSLNPKSTGLDSDEAVATSLVLELNDDKALADFSFAGADGIEQTLAIDSEDLLQLTDADCLDWFADDQEDLLSTTTSTSMSDESPVSSPLTLGRQTFQQLCPTSSESGALFARPLDSEDLELNFEDDEDFVLDPEKFLSSYFTTDTTPA